MLKDNPSAEATQLNENLVESLRAENERLQNMLDHGKNYDYIPRETPESLKIELENLQTQLQSKDKTILRLKEIYGAKIQDFRKCVHTLLGIIDLINRVFSGNTNGRENLETAVYLCQPE